MRENEHDSGSVSKRRGAQHRQRLQRLTDVVYGVIILQLFLIIPTPDETQQHWDTLSAYLSENGLLIAVVLVGVAWTIIYWVQNNVLLGTLRATDTLHCTFSILQLFFLLAFLYSLQLGLYVGGRKGTFAFESCSATVVGLCSLAAFAWARKKGLLHPDVSDLEAQQLAIRFRAEPITTGITVPFAFIPGPMLYGFSLTWEFSFFLYPIVIFIVNRVARKKANRQAK
jgi:hypothetical protein